MCDLISREERARQARSADQHYDERQQFAERLSSWIRTEDREIERGDGSCHECVNPPIERVLSRYEVTLNLAPGDELCGPLFPVVRVNMRRGLRVLATLTAASRFDATYELEEIR